MPYRRTTILFLIFGVTQTANASLKLSPQKIVDLVLQQGLEAKAITIDSEKAQVPLMHARGTYDWNISSSGSYELTRLETLMGLSDLEDRNTVWKLGVNKKFSTGTNLSLSYNRTFQNSTMSSFLSTAHLSDQVMDYVDVGFRQDLLNNFFGINDRRKETIAERDIKRADLKKRSDLQNLVLSATRTYWKAYVSGEALKQAVAAREKYQTLVNVVRNKLNNGLADPSDLGKVKTQYLAQDRRVKAASLQYLSDMDSLFSITRLPSARDVDFEIPPQLQPPAQESVIPIDDLRAVQNAKLGTDNSRDELESARLERYPELSLFGNMSLNGISQKAEQSFSEMTNGSHPRYLVGLELKYRLWSEASRGEVRLREILHDESINQLERVRDNQTTELTQSERNVRSTYIIAAAAEQTEKEWESIIKDRERQFRNARIGTTEIIQDYSFYFQSKADYVASVADYYFSLLRYRAAKDQLVP